MKKIHWFILCAVFAGACVALDFWWFDSQGYTAVFDPNDLAHDAMVRQLIFGNYWVAGVGCLAAGLFVACVAKAKRKVKMRAKPESVRPPLDVAQYAAMMKEAAHRRRVRSGWFWCPIVIPWVLGAILITVGVLVHMTSGSESCRQQSTTMSTMGSEGKEVPPVINEAAPAAAPIAESRSVLATVCVFGAYESPWWKDLEWQLAPFVMGSCALTMLGLMTGLFVWAFRQGVDIKPRHVS